MGSFYKNIGVEIPDLLELAKKRTPTKEGMAILDIPAHLTEGMIKYLNKNIYPSYEIAYEKFNPSYEEWAKDKVGKHIVKWSPANGHEDYCKNCPFGYKDDDRCCRIFFEDFCGTVNKGAAKFILE